MAQKGAADDEKEVQFDQETAVTSSDDALAQAMDFEVGASLHKRKGYVVNPEQRLEPGSAKAKLGKYDESQDRRNKVRSHQYEELEYMQVSTAEATPVRKGHRCESCLEGPSNQELTKGEQSNRVEEQPSRSYDNDRGSTERNDDEGSHSNSDIAESSDVSLSNHASVFGAGIGSLEEDADDERNAKREYNRVCAAKSRDKRKRTLSSLHAKVQTAATVFGDLLEKNKGLRESIDVTFHETINGLMVGEGVVSAKLSRPNSTEKG